MIDPVFLFVFAGLFSPGPNVLMLTASGARFGFRATVPHIAGVVIGVGIIAALTGAGIGAVLAVRPGLERVLQMVAAAWILWMAWSLWRSSAGHRDTRARPFRIHEAVLFQAVNPKVWAVTLAAASGYASGLPPLGEAARLGLIFAGLNLFVCLFWSAAGALLSLLLSRPEAWAIFARIMAVLLALSAIMVFF
ncbi:LysE family transporter [Rhodobacterales bacterium HKCCE3408]|nr:LysE family transporter [Rhodobacterales bacterium HKCCE3408]